MRFDGWDTIEGRHLVFIYATVFLIQGGYLLRVLAGWLRLGKASNPELARKADSPNTR